MRTTNNSSFMIEENILSNDPTVFSDHHDEEFHESKRHQFQVKSSNSYPPHNMRTLTEEARFQNLCP